MLSRLSLLTVALTLAACAPALAVELHTSFGDAEIDDQPFVGTGGQALPDHQVYPRGRVIDSHTDGHVVRIRVSALDASGGVLATYAKEESQGVWVRFDQLLSVSQRIAAVRFSFCRSRDESPCASPVTIDRPAPPPPPPPSPSPTAAPPPAPTATAPPAAPRRPAACANGEDDDLDGSVDLADPDCADAADDDESGDAPSEPQPVGTVVTPPGGCVAAGSRVKVSLKTKRRGRRSRARIVSVVFFTRARPRKVVVVRKAPFKASLPVRSKPGARVRVYARVRYRLPGRRRTFKRTVEQAFRICPA